MPGYKTVRRRRWLPVTGGVRNRQPMIYFAWATVP
jgi:hypothetical protein